MMSIDSVRQPHNTVNWRMKQSWILKVVSCHHITFHHVAFSALGVVTQVTFSNRDHLFQFQVDSNHNSDGVITRKWWWRRGTKRAVWMKREGH